MQKQESKKRQLDLNNTELDDSIASIRSDLLADKEPTMKDIAILMLRLIDRTESTRAVADDANERARMAEYNCEQLHRRAKDIEDTNETHRKQIKEIERKTNIHEASLNKIDQQRVDNDVFLSGFPIKPDHNKVAEKLAEVYGIQPEMIIDSYQFEIKAKPATESTPSASSTPNKKERIYHHVVITLKERSAKFELMRKKKQKGPLFYEQIDGNLQDENFKNSVIRCSHRLTRFNLSIQTRLLKAKNENKVAMFQLHNGIFRCKKDENSKWILIDTESSLNNLNLN